MILKLIGTVTIVAVVIAAGVVIWHGQQRKQFSLTAGGLMLILLSSVIAWGLWRPAPPPARPAPAPEAEAAFRASQTALPTDTPADIVHKMGCAVCHKIPMVPGATVGNVGPVLSLGTTAPLRLASAEYQARVKAGLAHATTAKEYVIESIVDPSAFIVPGYEPENNPGQPPMYAHYRDRFTPETLNFFALFLLQLDEQMAREQGLLNGTGVK